MRPFLLRHGLGLILSAAIGFAPAAQACSRLVYLGADNQVVTALHGLGG